MQFRGRIVVLSTEGVVTYVELVEKRQLLPKLYHALCEHRVGDFNKSCNVCAGNKVALHAVSLCCSEIYARYDQLHKCVILTFVCQN